LKKIPKLKSIPTKYNGGILEIPVRYYNPKSKKWVSKIIRKPFKAQSKKK